MWTRLRVHFFYKKSQKTPFFPQKARFRSFFSVKNEEKTGKMVSSKALTANQLATDR
jgi:hypothetical protein